MALSRCWRAGAIDHHLLSASSWTGTGGSGGTLPAMQTGLDAPLRGVADPGGEPVTGPNPAVITRSDLSTVAVAGPVVAFAGARLPAVVGQRAAVTLLPHMLLQRSMVAAGAGLAPRAGPGRGGGALRADPRRRAGAR